MEENSKNNNQNELDLIALGKNGISATKKAVKWTIGATLDVVKYSVKYWYVILICLAAGIGYSYLRQPKNTKVASFYVKNVGVQAEKVMSRINTLGQDNGSIAKELGVRDSIISIKATYANDENGDGCPDGKGNLKNAMKYEFHVTLEADANSDFEKIADAVIRKYNNEKFVKELSEYYIQTHLYEIQNYENQINSNISDAKKMYISNGNTQENQDNSKAASIEISPNMKEMIAEVSHIKLALTNQKQPLMIDSAISIAPGDNPHRHTVKIILLSLVLGIIIVLVIGKRKKISNWVNEDK